MIAIASVVFETCVDDGDSVYVRAIWFSGEIQQVHHTVEGPWMRTQDHALQALSRAMEGRLEVWRSLVRP